MRCCYLDHLLRHKFHTVSPPDIGSHALSIIPLDSRSGPTLTTSSGCVFQPFTTSVANDLFFDPVVTCSLTIIFPFLFVFRHLYLELGPTAAPNLDQTIRDLDGLY